MTPLVYCPSQEPILVLHRDADLLVVEKPAGLLSVPGKALEHRDCLETRLREMDPDALLVHRLDMDTSGVMVFARNKAAQRHLGLQFERRVLRKRYEALAGGDLSEDSGVIEAPLTSDWPNRPLQKVCYETGRKAKTEWQVLERHEASTRVSLIPHSGRTHQLRVHLEVMGAAILGDRFYGGALADRLMLHAAELELRHPSGGAWVKFSSDVPF